MFSHHLVMSSGDLWVICLVCMCVCRKPTVRHIWPATSIRTDGADRETMVKPFVVQKGLRCRVFIFFLFSFFFKTQYVSLVCKAHDYFSIDKLHCTSHCNGWKHNKSIKHIGNKQTSQLHFVKLIMKQKDWNGSLLLKSNYIHAFYSQVTRTKQLTIWKKIK